MILRWYQKEAIDNVYSFFREGKNRVLIALATGSGKGVIILALVQDAIKFNLRVAVVVKRREIIKQLSGILTKNKIDHGVYMADHYKYAPKKAVQVCSIDTLDARGTYPDVDLVLQDECFSADTEILTENGFIRFDELKEERVAQVETKSKRISFIVPIRKIVKTPTSKMIRLHSEKRIDLLSTENHDFLTTNMSGNEVKVKVKDIVKANYSKIFYSGFSFSDNCVLSPFEKLCICHQADGNNHWTKLNGESILSFSFDKQRKIDKFLELMNEGKFNYRQSDKIRKNRPTNKRFFVYLKEPLSKDVAKYFNLSSLSVNKSIEIIEYMNIWDGHVVSKDCYLYTGTDKKAANFYQAVCCLCGYKTKITKVIDKRSENFNDIYRLFIVKRNIGSTQKLKKEYIEYNEKVYCVTVPDGNIIIRRNGMTLVIGNCHDSAANNYKKLFNHYKDKKIIGLTATPYNDNSMFEAFTQPITNVMLRDEKFLVPDKIFIPSLINTNGIKIINGDFHNAQLEKAASESKIVGDIISNWKKYAESRRTILFAVNVNHSKLLAEMFNKEGIKAIHADASTNSKDRDIAIKKLKNREINILTNVNIFSVGVDIPEIEAISFCRPTHSLIYWIQAIGRGLRPSEGKEDCIILDHAGNTYRHGTAYTPRQITLDKPNKKKSEINTVRVKTCKQCFLVYDPNLIACPSCGHCNEKVGRKIVTEDGELIQYELSPEEIEKMQAQNFNQDFYKLKNTARVKNFKDSWIYYTLLKRYGKAFCIKYGNKILFPQWMLK